ncbi:hypothetical protein N7455_001169 [Penicillium solitum]|uniref:uncharacterized protein n=1 Tax=Penicillium solitum TaxID=60172 RepID=UPI0017D493BF|nr:hypothetical protein HAV15_008016 [Penicillium sp. str. \
MSTKVTGIAEQKDSSVLPFPDSVSLNAQQYTPHDQTAGASARSSLGTMATPYLVFVGSYITSPTLNPEDYDKWYLKHHCRDVMYGGGIPSAAWYHALQADSKNQRLVLYNCKDFDFMLIPEKLDAIPKTHELLENGKHLYDVAQLDPRHYEIATPAKGPYPGLVVVAYELPQGADDDLEEWYTATHLPIFLGLPGYKQSQQYLLHPSLRTQKAASHLVLHEFETSDDLQSPDNKWLENLKTDKVVATVDMYRLVQVY